MYLSYDRYTEMGGEVDEAAFVILERKAAAKLDYFTQERLHAVEDLASYQYVERVEEAMFQLINALNTDVYLGDGLSSYSNGVESFSFSEGYDADAPLYRMVVEILPVELVSASVD